MVLQPSARRPRSLVAARTRPKVFPTTIGSWTFKVSRWTRRAATAPFPLSKQADNGTDGTNSWSALSSDFSHKKTVSSSSILVELSWDFYKLRIATPVAVDNPILFRTTTDDTFWVGTWFINLVNSHNDWDIRRFWVVNTGGPEASPLSFKPPTKMVISVTDAPRCARIEVKAAWSRVYPRR